MTKFEEVLNKVIFNGVAPRTNEKFYLKSILLRVFSNWHSDEEFKIEENEVKRLFTENKELKGRAEFAEKRACEFSDKLDCASERVVLLEGTVDDLKSQLQQKALPVVPECVGKELYNIDFNYWIENKMTLACFTARTLNWLEQHRGDWNIEYYICKLRFGGFTVEKPQLFYLKHIDMSKADKECDWYLITDCVKLCHEWVGKNLKPKDDDFKFTQAEIDSMQTGSYEQIEVAE